MSVDISFSGGEKLDPKRYADEKTAYAILESGVLQVLRRGEGAWFVDCEYSPNYWNSVSGTRYDRDTAKIQGSDGKSQHDPSPIPHGFVV